MMLSQTVCHRIILHCQNNPSNVLRVLTTLWTCDESYTALKLSISATKNTAM